VAAKAQPVRSCSVLARGDGLEVRWVAARSVAAQVIDVEAGGDGADVPGVGEPMHSDPAIQCAETPVPVPVERPDPEPTAVWALLDSGIEPGQRIGISCHLFDGL
jgi:hypothetical protein